MSDGDPLQVLVGEDQRALGRHPPAQPHQRGEDALPALVDRQAEEAVVGRQRAQQREQRHAHGVGVAVERDDPAGDLLLHDLDVVGLGDVEVLPQDVHARAIAGAAAVRRAAAVERQHVLARDGAQEFVHEPRLADPGLADDDGDAARRRRRATCVERVEQLLRARRRAR